MFSLFSRTKICSRCHTKKPEKEFPKRAKSSDGRNSWCLQCHRDYKQKHKAHLITLDFAKSRQLLLEIEQKSVREGCSPQDVIMEMLEKQITEGEA